MAYIEYILTIDGCPYAMATAGCPETVNASGDPSWGTWTLAIGHLRYPEGAIKYTMRPDGGFDGGPLSFRVHDLAAEAGPYAGVERLATKLFTRHHTRVPRTRLSTTIALSDTTGDTFDVAYGPVLGNVVWIDGEAILVEEHAGNTLTIATRGYYGTRPRRHAPGGDVYGEFPFVTRRRCLLWEVDEAGFAQVCWRGYLEASAKTVPNESDYALDAKHVSTYLAELDMGLSEASPRMLGYDTFAVRVMIRFANNNIVDSYFSGRQVAQWCGSGTELANALQAAVGAALPGSTLSPSVTFDSGELIFSAKVGNGAAVGISVAGEETWVDGATNGNGGSFAQVQAALSSVCRFVPASASNATFVVDDVSDLPSTFDTRASTVDNVSSFVTPVLRAPISDAAWLVIQPSATSNATTPPTITGGAYLAARAPGTFTNEQLGATWFANPVPRTGGPFGTHTLGLQGFMITEPLTFTQSLRTSSAHWLYDLMCNVVNRTDGVTITPSDPPEHLGERIDPRDWTWSTASEVLRHTAGGPSARVRYLDGRTKALPYFVDACVPNGCGLAVREKGCMAVVVIRPPLDSDDIAVTVTSSDYALRGRNEQSLPEISEQPEALVNSAVVEATDASVKVNELPSQRRYGNGRSIRVKLLGVDSLADFGSSPAAIATSVTSRLTKVWSDTVQIARFQLLADFRTAMCGDRLLLSDDYFLPDGKGDRGITNGRMLVCEYVRPFGDGALISLSAWRWTIYGFAGYSLAGRVDIIEGNVLKLKRSYLDCASTKNYAGTDPITGDGGASQWKPDFKARLMRMDWKTYVSESIGRIAYTTSNELHFVDPIPTSPIDWPALLAGGAWVDVMFDDYETIVAVEDGAGDDAQKGYCWIGEPSGTDPPYVIGGSLDEAKRWAP